MISGVSSKPVSLMGAIIDKLPPGCTVLDPPGSVPGTVSIDGNSLPNAPKWIGNLTARYGIPMVDGTEFFVFTDWAYRDKVNFFLYESAEFQGDALVEGGLRVGYSWEYGNKEVALFGRNITLTGGPAPVRAYLEQAIPQVLDGTINPGLVFDRVLPLDQTAEGYRLMDDREALKVMIRP